MVVALIVLRHGRSLSYCLALPQTLGHDVSLVPITASPTLNVTDVRPPVNTPEGSWLEPYFESIELMHSSREVREKAWTTWRDKRKELRRIAFARLRDALALGWTGAIDVWKQRVVDLGPEDHMPSFDDVGQENTPIASS